MDCCHAHCKSFHIKGIYVHLLFSFFFVLHTKLLNSSFSPFVRHFCFYRQVRFHIHRRIVRLLYYLIFLYRQYCYLPFSSFGAFQSDSKMSYLLVFGLYFLILTASTFSSTFGCGLMFFNCSWIFFIVLHPIVVCWVVIISNPKLALFNI